MFIYDYKTCVKKNLNDYAVWTRGEEVYVNSYSLKCELRLTHCFIKLCFQVFIKITHRVHRRWFLRHEIVAGMFLETSGSSFF